MLAALAVPGGAEAHAGELLVIPYSCTVVSGQPVLTPGPEQGHRIIGPRDQRKFTACSPVNPGMCRSWTLQRFDLDCDGTRVSWVSVVAATNEGSRRAWLLNGRLVLRMGPSWSLAPDDPCARETPPDERFAPPRMRRQCADRLASAPPPVVEMPFGYAPMLGIDGIIVKSAPKVSGGPAPLPPLVAGSPGKISSAEAKELANTAPAWPEPEPWEEPAKAKEAPLKAPAPVPAVAPQAGPQITAPQPKPAPEAKRAPEAAAQPPQEVVPPPVPKPASATATEKTPADKAAPAEGKTATGPRPVPVALATPPKEPAPASPPAATVAPVPETSVSPSVSEAQKRLPAANKVTPADDASAVAKAAAGLSAKGGAQPAVEPETTFSPNTLSLFRTTTAGALVAFAGLALGLLTAFALARRREHTRDAGRRRRDISSVSLDSRRAKAAARAAEPRHRPAPSTPPALPSKVEERSVAPANNEPDWGDRMPRTREEALEVLGIGIAPSANEAAIKKIVDGLRMSWHPDLSKDETDRVLRELRSKQINAAWEILQGQRAVV